jgi:hypothetical protein
MHASYTHTHLVTMLANGEEELRDLVPLTRASKQVRLGVREAFDQMHNVDERSLG